MIVLTGGIGSGKSVVARILREKGYGVFDCDYEARCLMENDEALRTDIKTIAGEDVYADRGDGKLDRKKLASIIFTDEEKRSQVNSSVHREVKKRLAFWLKENPLNIFVETAVAGESGLADMAEEIWLVYASAPVRVSRVLSRDGRSETETLRIISAQMGEEEFLAGLGSKVKVIKNDEGDTLLPQIEKLI